MKEHVNNALGIGGLVIASAFFGGKYLPDQPQRAIEDTAVSHEDSLRVPAEVLLQPGEPAEVAAETRGSKVFWMPLDKGLSAKASGARSVWVWADAEGEYRLVCWTAVGNVPTPNATTVVKVKKSTK